MTRSSSSSNTLSVYTGRTHLGSVDRRGNGFVAITADGTVIGTFETQREAAAALPSRPIPHE